MSRHRLLVVVGLTAATACGSEPITLPIDPEPVEVPAAATAWLQANAIPFGGTFLDAPHTDIEPLREIVGDARVVSLGENTHGTRDFFEMKARVLRFLVEEMGFDAFAIEASWPESNRLDQYVRTGEGDPAVLLSGLYFWTWRTESVLEMIEWMRAHNAAGGNVGFYGFDMQYPGMAIWNLRNYIDDVDPDRSYEVAEHVRCLQSLANNAQGEFLFGRLGDMEFLYRESCLATLDTLEADFLQRESEYVTASSQTAFDIAARSLRVALQLVEIWVGRHSRDQVMADNAAWITSQLGSDGKIVLWAHNFHVSTNPVAMGADLRRVFGDDMVVIGFSHTEGDFTAATQSGSASTGLAVHSLRSRRDLSYEHYFSSAGMPSFILDLRAPDLVSGDRAWLAGPREARGIGCCYDPGMPSRYWSSQRLPELYDAIIHIERTRATTVLPATLPTDFSGN